MDGEFSSIRILYFYCTFCVLLKGFTTQKALASGAPPQTPMVKLPGSPIPSSWAGGVPPSPGRLRLHTRHYLQPDFLYGGDGPARQTARTKPMPSNPYCLLEVAGCTSGGRPDETILVNSRTAVSLVPRPTSQLRMDYITATRVAVM